MRDERKFITNTTSQPDAFIRDFSGYSDHELHDIGIDRADIHDIARRVSEEQQ